MKKYKLNFLSFFVILLLSSCSINSTSYNYVDKNKIVKFETKTFDKKITSDSIFYMEIVADSLKILIKKHKISVIINKTTVCGGFINSLTNYIIFLNKIIEKYKDIKFIFIFSGFEINNVKKMLDKTNYNQQFYFIHHKYGNNVGCAEKNFYIDLCDYELKSNILYREPIEWFIFQEGIFIKAGYGRPELENKLDSIYQINY